MRIIRRVLVLGLILVIFLINVFNVDVLILDIIKGNNIYEMVGLIVDKKSYDIVIMVNMDNFIVDGFLVSGFVGVVDVLILFV